MYFDLYVDNEAKPKLFFDINYILNWASYHIQSIRPQYLQNLQKTIETQW